VFKNDLDTSFFFCLFLKKTILLLDMFDENHRK